MCPVHAAGRCRGTQTSGGQPLPPGTRSTLLCPKLAGPWCSSLSARPQCGDHHISHVPKGSLWNIPCDAHHAHIAHWHWKAESKRHWKGDACMCELGLLWAGLLGAGRLDRGGCGQGG